MSGNNLGSKAKAMVALATALSSRDCAVTRANLGSNFFGQKYFLRTEIAATVNQ